MGMVGGEDYRFYINKLDITTAVKQVIQNKIALIPQSVLKQQYLEGVHSYFQLLKALDVFNNETKSDPETAQLIANTKDWPGQFSTLGDRQKGWSGNLHPLNFLYRFIKMPPLSLREIWSTYRAKPENSSLPVDFTLLPIDSITITEGPWAFLENYDATTFIPGGRLVFQMKIIYENPLKEPLNRILKSLNTLKEETDRIRLYYLEPSLASIEQTGQDVTHMEKSINERLRQLTDTVNQIG
jgi:hypothetical protein